MVRLCAQGDILIEHVGHVPASGQIIDSMDDGSAIVAAGEKTGHHHRIFGSVILYRDDALALEVPAGLYVVHLQVKGSTARLEHEEHAPIALQQGTYRMRRQRQLEPTDLGIFDQSGAVED